MKSKAGAADEANHMSAAAITPNATLNDLYKTEVWSILPYRRIG
jgi:hypothetical protein